MADPTRLLTLPETATRIGVSVRTVQREVADRRLRPTYIRGRTMFTEREVEAYLAAAYRRSA